MISKIELLKGIHPGVYLARELQRRELRGGTLASRIGAYRQNLNAILQGRRNMNLPLSLKIEQELDLPEGFLMTLQLHYDIARTKREQYAGQHPDRTKFRPVRMLSCILFPFGAGNVVMKLQGHQKALGKIQFLLDFQR